MKKFTLAVAMAAVLATGTGHGALASPSDPNSPDPHASCIGLISADHARGIPDGMTRNDISAFIKEIADTVGVVPGYIYSSGARLHLGSHKVCGNE